MKDFEKMTARDIEKAKSFFAKNCDCTEQNVEAFDSYIELMSIKESYEQIYKTAKKDKDAAGMFEALTELEENGLIQATDDRLKLSGSVMPMIVSEYGDDAYSLLNINEEAVNNVEILATEVKVMIDDAVANGFDTGSSAKKSDGEKAPRQKKEEKKIVVAPNVERQNMQLFDRYHHRIELASYPHMLLRLEYGKEGTEPGTGVKFDALFEEGFNISRVQADVLERDERIKYIPRYFKEKVMSPEFVQDFKNGDAAILFINNREHSFPLKRVGLILCMWKNDEADGHPYLQCMVGLNIVEMLELRVGIKEAKERVQDAIELICSTHRGEPIDDIRVRFGNSIDEAIKRQSGMMDEDAVELADHKQLIIDQKIADEAEAKLKAEKKEKEAIEKAERAKAREERRLAKQAELEREKEERAEAKREAEEERQRAENAARAKFVHAQQQIAEEEKRLGRQMSTEEKLAFFDPEIVAAIRAKIAQDKANATQA